MAHFAGDTVEPERERGKLQSAMQGLDMGDLNALSAMWMVGYPDDEAGATGRGGVWVRASVEVNKAALSTRNGRPLFEMVK